MAQRPTKNAETSKRHRALYIGQRVRELQAELKALRAESRQVRDSLRGLTDRKTPEAKALRARRAYTVLRPDEAKAELQRLTDERKAMRTKSAD